jgi:hypothetical protein
MSTNQTGIVKAMTSGFGAIVLVAQPLPARLGTGISDNSC